MINGILLLYHHTLGSDASTIMEHVNCFNSYSKFKIWNINTELGLPKGLKDIDFQIIVLHYSLFGSANYCINQDFFEYLDNCSSSYKIAFFQDEYYYCQQRFAFINKYKIDCIYTLLEPQYFKDVYQKYTTVPELIYNIPGYVSDNLMVAASMWARNDNEREIDIGYRGRQLPFYMGKGAQEKTEIAIEFKKRASELGLVLDLETDEHERLYGARWYQFLGNCKGVLGVEAGVTIFDLEDVVRQEYNKLVAQKPGISFAELSQVLLEPMENRIFYRTISPRAFEAAAFRICQILFEGKYSGILEPMKHYIPLRKDFSNFDEVIKLFKNESLRKELTQNAYRDLIISGRYSYRGFIENFDRALMNKGFGCHIDESDICQVNLALNKDYYKRMMLARAKSLLYMQFPGRKGLVKVYRQFYRTKV